MAQTTSKLKIGNVTKQMYPAASATLSATGWSVTNNVGTLTMAASQTAGTATIPLTHLNVGDVITAFRVHGGTTGTTATKTLDAALHKATPHATDGSITDTAIQSATQDATQTAHKFTLETTLTTPERVTKEYMYYLLITGTTAAADTYNISSIEVDIRCAWGQPV